MRITLTKRNTGIVELYDRIASRMGYDKDYTTYDCRRIRVAEDVSEWVHQWYKETYAEKLGDDWKQKFGMEWLNYGPKVDLELPSGTVDIEDGFIEYREEVAEALA